MSGGHTVNPDALLRYLRFLGTKGITQAMVAREAGISTGCISTISSHGNSRVLRSTAESILSVHGSLLAPQLDWQELDRIVAGQTPAKTLVGKGNYARALFDKGWTQSEICIALHSSSTNVKRWRDELPLSVEEVETERLTALLEYREREVAQYFTAYQAALLREQKWQELAESMTTA